MNIHPGNFCAQMICGLVIAGMVCTISAHAAIGTSQWVPGRLLVQPRSGLSEEQFGKILKGQGAKSVGVIDGINVHIVQLPAHASEKAVAALLAKNPHIKFAELDRTLPAAATANDPYYGIAWQLPKIGVPTAWDSSTGQNVVIAILDTGVNGNHPDLAGRLVPGWNFYDNNSNTSDVQGHGTAVAGAASADTNNGVGVASVAGGAYIMPVRIADATANATGSMIAQGLTWAADHGAKVANISYANVPGNTTIQTAAQYMKNKGGLVIVAAGNSGAFDSTAPTTTMIPVSATDANDAITSFSSYGNYVQLAAPGVNIPTTDWGGGYQSAWGTSISSPIVAGVVAQMMAANPALGPTDIQNLLFSTATDLGAAGIDPYYGHGRVNAAAAVQAAKAAVPQDATPPAVSLTAPANGATVSGLVAVNVSATDNVGVSQVTLLVNGVQLASDISSPYGFSWDSTRLPNGNATLTAYAYDAAGNSSSSSITVNVSNAAAVTADTTAPTAVISNPIGGAKVSGTVGVTASASDNVGVKTLSLYIDGTLQASVSGASLSYNWNTRKAAAGSHTLLVKAQDAAGNIGSKSIQVTK